MSLNRVVPNMKSGDLRGAARFYTDVLGMEVVMDHSWIITVADPDRPELQLSLMTEDATAPAFPVVSLEVPDVDAVYQAARASGAEIVYELTDEEWGVRRFFVRDPNGHVLNVLSHR